MGLAASQARYLALTARKSDLEYQSQTINTRRIQLAYKTAEIAKAYSEGMNNQKIMYSVPTKTVDGKTTDTWKELTYQGLLDEGCVLIGTNGSKVNPQPYKIESLKGSLSYSMTATGAPTYDSYNKIPESLREFYMENPNKVEESNETDTETEGTEETNEPETTKWMLKLTLDSSEYEKLLKADTSLARFYTGIFSEETTVSHDAKAYENSRDSVDIQSLLVSGKAQIVTKGFFDFLVANGYTYDKGISPQLYQQLTDMWTSQTQGYNIDGQDSVIDWRTDESSQFKQRNYTEDDADVLARYEAATAEVQAQDKVLEVEEKNIETQHKAIETEMESVKKVIQKNMEETFKIFS